MPIRTLKANSNKSKVRAKVEHVFAVQKEQSGSKELLLKFLLQTSSIT